MRPRKLSWKIAFVTLLPALSSCVVVAALGEPVAVAFCLAAAIIASYPAARLSMRLSADLREMRAAARRFVDGRASERVWCDTSEETAELSAALNRAARRFGARMLSERSQREELDATLSTMKEGVIVIDSNERVLSINHSAVDMAGWTRGDPAGRTLQEIFRHPTIHTLARSIAEREENLDARIDLGDGRIIRAYGRPLDGDRGLIVLQDISRVVQLEDLRRDFVANVSHELKTPITSITGFVETLLDTKDEDIDERRRFLEIIRRQAERLNAIFDDLLALSRIERVNETLGLDLSVQNVRILLESAIEQFRDKAAEGKMEIALECESGLEAPAHFSLLEQAVVNLLDNAIKHSRGGSRITVSSEIVGKELSISVADNGPGIEARHLPRLFERFYRADSGRSRDQGGTGLGLAIVKHIAEGHGGRVSVESAPGAGSRFSIHIPAARSHKTNNSVGSS